MHGATCCVQGAALGHVVIVDWYSTGSRGQGGGNAIFGLDQVQIRPVSRSIQLWQVHRVTHVDQSTGLQDQGLVIQPSATTVKPKAQKNDCNFNEHKFMFSTVRMKSKDHMTSVYVAACLCAL